MSTQTKHQELRCPKGHTGPWRYVEAIEVFREVEGGAGKDIKVQARWETGEGYDTGIPGSAYLLCCADGTLGRCIERVELPNDAQVEFVL